MKRFYWLLAGLVFFLLFHVLIDIIALSSVAKIDLVVEPDQNDRLSIYYSSGIAAGGFQEQHSVRSQLLTQGVKSTVSLLLKNRTCRKIRLDPLQEEGTIKIYSIKFLSQFGAPVYYDHERIADSFRPGEGTTISLQDEYVLVQANGPDPQLLLERDLVFPNPIFSYILPLFLSFFCVILCKNLQIQNFAAIRDISNKKPSTNKNIVALDGLRGLAALLVLADHTGFTYFQGLGAIGVWLFFCLSGFLLSIPFVKEPARILDPGYVQHYFARRIKRIVPMYYTVLVVFYLLRGRFGDFFRQAIFIQGDGIFWSIPQEMFFYMILPFILLANIHICRGNTRLIFVFTLALAVVLNQYMTDEYLYVYGNGRRLPLQAGIFCTGVALSYFYHSPYVRFFEQRSRAVLSSAGLFLLIALLLSSDSILDAVFHLNVNYTWEYTGLYGYLAALLLFFTIIKDDTILNKILSILPLRAVGIVGFSFYLLHPTVMDMVKYFSNEITGVTVAGLPLFFVGAIATYLFAAITYSLIERPFLRK
jgi:peptidoglycan/LPS O-acetylase OafA/YrhL